MYTLKSVTDPEGVHLEPLKGREEPPEGPLIPLFPIVKSSMSRLLHRLFSQKFGEIEDLRDQDATSVVMTFKTRSEAENVSHTEWTITPSLSAL